MEIDICDREMEVADGKRIISVKKDMQYEQDCCGCGVATSKTRVVMS